MENSPFKVETGLVLLEAVVLTSEEAERELKEVWEEAALEGLVVEVGGAAPSPSRSSKRMYRSSPSLWPASPASPLPPLAASLSASHSSSE